MYLLTHYMFTVAFYDQESGKGHQLKSFGLVKMIFDTTTDTKHFRLVPDNKSINFLATDIIHKINNIYSIILSKRVKNYVYINPMGCVNLIIQYDLIYNATCTWSA